MRFSWNEAIRVTLVRTILWSLLSFVFIWLIFRAIALASSKLQPVSEFRSKVSAGTLYGLLRSNVQTAANEDDAMMHIAYDFDADAVVLLRVTKETIERVCSYARPIGSRHVSFGRSYGATTEAYKTWLRKSNDDDSSPSSPPPLEALARIVDRNEARDWSSDVRVATFARPLSVSIRTDDSSKNTATVTYTDRNGAVLRVRLPSGLMAECASLFARDGGGGGCTVRLFRPSPCSNPSRVTYEDFRRYYVAKRSNRNDATKTISREERERVLPTFSWSCRSVDDFEPILLHHGGDDKNTRIKE